MTKSKRLTLLVLAGVFILAILGGCVPPVGGTATPSQGQDASSIIPLIIFLVLIFGMFYLLILRPQRRRQKEQQQLMTQLKKGDRVITAGGIYGVIESADADTIVIKVESGALLRVARSSIAGKRER